MGRRSILAEGVVCYNVAEITIGDFSVVSQRSFLCSASHKIDDPSFPLVARAIEIEAGAWIAAEAFVGPGVKIEKGAVLGARACAFQSLEAYGVYRGNPAVRIKYRNQKSGSI